MPRSWKHFGAVLEFLRDGSCELPNGYAPSGQRALHKRKPRVHVPSLTPSLTPTHVRAHGHAASSPRPLPLPSRSCSPSRTRRLRYTPTTYDNRRSTTEEAELREFVSEAGWYRIRPLVDMASRRLLSVLYGGNAPMLAALRAKGLPA